MPIPRFPNTNDGAGIPTAITRASNPDLQRMRVTYDRADRMVRQVSDPGGLAITSEYRYDLNDNPTLELHPRGFEAANDSNDYATASDYNARDELVSTTDALGGVTTIERDKTGRVVAQTSPRGNATGAADDLTTRMTYDENGNLTSRSIPYATDQYGLAESVYSDWKISYSPDEVGDPTYIADARSGLAPEELEPGTPQEKQTLEDNEFVIKNGFLDTGQLASTTRPSWWRMDWSSPHENSPAGERFAERDGGLRADLAVPPGGPSLQEGGPGSGDEGGEGSSPSGPMAGDFGTVDPEEVGDMLPRAGEATFTYDDAGRLRKSIDTEDSVHEITYDDAGRITEKRWPFKPGQRITHDFAYDQNGNLERFGDGLANAPGEIPGALGDSIPGGLGPADYETSFDYDVFDRRVAETSPGSADTRGGGLSRETTSWGYDPNSNVVERTTPRGPGISFDFTYDEIDRLTSEANPLDEKWSYTHDAAGNQTSVQTPRGNAQSDAAFATDSSFDRLNRKVRIDAPQSRTTTLEYDPDGNVVRSVEPGSKASVGGEIAERVTETDYDGPGQPWRTTTGVGGDDDLNEVRTNVTVYDGNQNVVREVNPDGLTSDDLPIGDYDPHAAGNEQIPAATYNSTLNRYTADDQLKSTYLPHANQGGTGTDTRYVTDRLYDDRGWVRSINHAYEVGEPDVETTRASYKHYDNGWIRALADEKDVPASSDDPVPAADITYDYDPRGVQTEWITEGFENDNIGGRKIRREVYPSGMLAKRVGIKPTGEDVETTRRSYSHYYNQNRSLVETYDKLPNDLPADLPPGFADERTTEITRDDAERETIVDETFDAGRKTRFSYDPDGNVSERTVSGRTTTFTYDTAGRERTSEIYKASDGTSGEPMRQTETTWWPSDDLQQRTKANDTVEDRYYLATGDLIRKVRDPKSGETEPTDYAYDLRGNRTTDERGTHTYDARDHLTAWTRSDDYEEEQDDGSGQMVGGTTTYEVDGIGEIEKVTNGTEADPLVTESEVLADGEPNGETATTETNSTADHIYVDGQLDRITVTGNATTSLPDGTADTTEIDEKSVYYYDDLGNTKRIVDKGSDEPDPANPPVNPGACEGEMDRWDDPRTTYHCYDEFSRLVAASGKAESESGNEVSPNESWIYDGLDRRDLKLTEEDGETKSRERNYVGTTELLAMEKDTDPDGETTTRRYDYDAQGLRVGRESDEDADPDAEAFRSYDHDAQGSVVGLEGDDGGVAEDDRYLYDPYGALQDPDPGDAAGDEAEEELSEDAQSNPFRFQGHYYDSAIESYDMRARQYRPESGRFLTQDRFEAAGADLELQSDPLTQNRYAFAGGNPVSRIEFDGHVSGNAACHFSGGSSCGSQPKRDKSGGGGNSGGGSSGGGSSGGGSASIGGSGGTGSQARTQPPGGDPIAALREPLTLEGLFDGSVNELPQVADASTFNTGEAPVVPDDGNQCPVVSSDGPACAKIQSTNESEGPCHHCRISATTGDNTALPLPKLFFESGGGKVFPGVKPGSVKVKAGISGYIEGGAPGSEKVGGLVKPSLSFDASPLDENTSLLVDIDLKYRDGGEQQLYAARVEGGETSRPLGPSADLVPFSGDSLPSELEVNVSPIYDSGLGASTSYRKPRVTVPFGGQGQTSYGFEPGSFAIDGT